MFTHQRNRKKIAAHNEKNFVEYYIRAYISNSMVRVMLSWLDRAVLKNSLACRSLNSPKPPNLAETTNNMLTRKS